MSIPSTKPEIKGAEFVYTAKVIEGKVYLSLITNPNTLIGPFAMKSPTEYIYEADGKGIHSLTKHPVGGWSYSCSYIHMQAQPVDANALPNR